MKGNIFTTTIIVFILGCAIRATSTNSNQTPDKFHSEVEVTSYFQKNMIGIAVMRRTLAYLDCYNEFIPLINSLASNTKDASNCCVNDAIEQKDKEFAVLNDIRKVVINKIVQLLKLLTDCSEQEGLNYFHCMADNNDSISIMEYIKELSRKLRFDYNAKFAKIDSEELTCLKNSVDMAKYASDKIFGDLMACVKGDLATPPPNTEGSCNL